MIAIFLPSLRGGGAERMMVNLSKGFAKCGLKVDLVLTKAEGPYLSMRHKLGWSTCTLPEYRPACPG